MDRASRPSRREGILSSTRGDSRVLLVPDTGEYFTLAEVGARIPELADGSRTVEEIAGVLASEYDAPPETIEREAVEFLQELESASLVAMTASDA